MLQRLQETFLLNSPILLKNHTLFIKGEYKSDGFWHEDDNPYEGLMNANKNDCILNYYLPHKVGKWKYYDDYGILIREEDYGD